MQEDTPWHTSGIQTDQRKTENFIWKVFFRFPSNEAFSVMHRFFKKIHSVATEKALTSLNKSGT